MAGQVYVDQMRCSSSADAADDTYMVIFRGGYNEPFESGVGVIAGNFWSDFDDGEQRETDIPIAKYYADNTYVVALLERDADNDLTDPDNNASYLQLLRAQAGLAWRTYLTGLRAASLSNGLWPPTSQQLAAAAKVVIEAINGTLGLATTWPVGDDDRIGGAKHLKISPGEQPVLTFVGEGGDYTVWFKIK